MVTSFGTYLNCPLKYMRGWEAYLDEHRVDLEMIVLAEKMKNITYRCSKNGGSWLEYGRTRIRFHE